MTKLGIGWEVGVASGWGMYGLNLALELLRRNIEPALFFVTQPLVVDQDQAALLAPALKQAEAWNAAFQAGPFSVDFPLLHSLGDQLFLPDRLRQLKGRPSIGVPFCESAVIPKDNLALARDFAGFITGSSWNAGLLAAHGLGPVHNCPQGVDLSRFKPGPRRTPAALSGRFTVFSGGKLEYRKGQDLVVAAFKTFQARHPDAVLVTAWHSPWPAAAAKIVKSHHVTSAPKITGNRLDVGGWLLEQGLPAGSFVDLGDIGHHMLPDVLRAMDVALMPSRCEGGTNLVAMECMACAVPVILSRNTGHLDLITTDNSYPLEFQIPMGEVTGRPDLNGWGESSVDEMVTRLEAVYADRTEASRRGAAGAAFMEGWGWPAQIGRLLDAVAALS